MRTIDADKLKEVLEKNFGHTGGASVLAQLIDAQDTVQPEPSQVARDIARIVENEQDMRILPKRGKWIKTARWGRVYYCDQCRNYLDFDGVNAGRGSTNFCPNCGADMRGEQDG